MRVCECVCEYVRESVFEYLCEYVSVSVFECVSFMRDCVHLSVCECV